jgi:hypothetical protein
MSKDQEERIQLTCSGLKCDNESCDYENPTIKVEDYKEWIDKPCPKCGENLLTQEDFDNTMVVIEMTKMFNDMPEDMFQLITDASKDKKSILDDYDLPPDTERVNIKLDMHKGVKIKEVTAVKKAEEE